MSSNPHIRRAAALATLLFAACTDDGPADDGATPACVEIDYEGCALLYPPTWDQVWEQTITTSCSGGGAACHDDGEDGERLRLVEPDAAYLALTEGEHPQVIPGDPRCSPLLIRLESEDPTYRMPPGNTALAAGARCSIATWVAAGATQD